MRGNALASVVIAALTLSVVITLGCGGSPSGPSPAARSPASPTQPISSPPVISKLFPNIGSTSGGTLMIINGTGVGSAVTVTVGGIVSTFEPEWGPDDPINLLTPAHAAGTVEVIVTDRYGQTGSGMFAYASPATFDSNGDWEGWAYGPSQWPALLSLTIRDNIVVSFSCSVCNLVTCEPVPSVTLDPPPVVANGEFSFAGSGGGINGKILSPNYASGSINMASCVSSGQWTAGKR